MAHLGSIVVPCALALGCSSASPQGIDGAGPGEPDGGPRADARDLGADGPPAGPSVIVFDDDYGDGVTYAPFGGSTGGPSIVAEDPYAGGTSLRFDVPSAGYTGGAFRAAVPVDLSGFVAVSFWARASRAATLNVVGLGNDAASTTYWAERTALPLDTTWRRFVVPAPLAAPLTAERGLFHVAGGADEGAYTLWLDEIRWEALDAGFVGPPQPAIATETVTAAVGGACVVNGAAVTFTLGGQPWSIAASRRYFTFASSAPAIASVDAEGRVTALAAGTATITARLGEVDAVGALTVEVAP